MVSRRKLRLQVGEFGCLGVRAWLPRGSSANASDFSWAFVTVFATGKHLVDDVVARVSVRGAVGAWQLVPSGPEVAAGLAERAPGLQASLPTRGKERQS